MNLLGIRWGTNGEQNKVENERMKITVGKSMKNCRILPKTTRRSMLTAVASSDRPVDGMSESFGDVMFCRCKIAQRFRICDELAATRMGRNCDFDSV